MSKLQKILVMMIMTLLSSCSDFKSNDVSDLQIGVGELSKYDHINIYLIDSCEYIGLNMSTSGAMLTHKGNCKFCEHRKIKKNRTIDSLTTENKQLTKSKYENLEMDGE